MPEWGIAACGTKVVAGSAFVGTGGATCDSPGSIAETAPKHATLAVAAAAKINPLRVILLSIINDKD